MQEAAAQLDRQRTDPTKGKRWLAVLSAADRQAASRQAASRQAAAAAGTADPQLLGTGAGRLLLLA
jgi:hypothetical protein